VINGTVIENDVKGIKWLMHGKPSNRCEECEEKIRRFLDSFCRIEKYLRESTQSNRSEKFYELIEKASRSNRAVRVREDDLKELANLRNVLVHERREGKPIAIPSEAAVSLIEEIEGYITKPPEVIPTFQRDVLVCNPEDPIAIALEAMYKYKYSQIPIVHNGKFTKLLTTNTITNWLGSCITDEHNGDIDSRSMCLC